MDPLEFHNTITKDIVKWYLKQWPGFKFRHGDKEVTDEHVMEFIDNMNITGTAKEWAEISEKYWRWYTRCRN